MVLDESESASCRIEPLAQPFPAAVVLRLKLWRLERKARRTHYVTRLEHERHGVGDARRLGKIGVRCFLERIGVGPMSGHAVVQACATRQKAFGLGVVYALDQSHELACHVAVEPRWAESVLHRENAGRKDHEVDRVD